MYSGGGALICTLPRVRCLYFDEDTLICTLLSVRWLYFVRATRICTLCNMHCSRDSISAAGESTLLSVGEGILHSSLDESILLGILAGFGGDMGFLEVFALSRYVICVFSTLNPLVSLGCFRFLRVFLVFWGLSFAIVVCLI